MEKGPQPHRKKIKIEIIIKNGWDDIAKSSTDYTWTIPLLVDAKRGLRNINHSSFFKMPASHSDTVGARSSLS